MRPPKNWQSAEQTLKFKGKNACCIRTGFGRNNCSLVVVDADGADAIVVVDELVRRTCQGLVVPMVQTQRGANGRHYYFPRDANDEPQERREARHRRRTDERRRACRYKRRRGRVRPRAADERYRRREVRAPWYRCDPRGTRDAGAARGDPTRICQYDQYDQYQCQRDECDQCDRWHHIRSRGPQASGTSRGGAGWITKHHRKQQRQRRVPDTRRLGGAFGARRLRAPGNACVPRVAQRACVQPLLRRA